MTTKSEYPSLDLSLFSDDLEQALHHCQGSPDMPKLARKPGHLCFLYDRYKPGYPMHAFLKSYGAVRVAGGFTSLKCFTMMEHVEVVKEKEIQVPIAFYSPSAKGNTGRIQGDLMLLSPEAISYLDYMLDNTCGFNRVQTAIRFHNPYNSAQKIVTKAFMWVGNKAEWDEDRLFHLKRYYLNMDNKDYFFTYKGIKSERVTL